MGESELSISLDENSGTFDVPDNSKFQTNLRHLQTHIFSPIMSKQFNISSNRNRVGDRQDFLVVPGAKSVSQDKSSERFVAEGFSPKLDVEETCSSINEEDLFGDGDQMKIGSVDRKDYCDENVNDTNNGQSNDEDISQMKKISSQQRNPKWNHSHTPRSFEQDATSQRRSRFRGSKDLEVIKDSVSADENSPEAENLEQSKGIPDIIRSSSRSSQSSFASSITSLQNRSPDVVNAVECDVFNNSSDEPDGYCTEDKTLKEKLEKKIYIEGISHYPPGMSKPLDGPPVVHSPSLLGPHPESPADEKRVRFRSSGYGTDSKQSQNSQNSMECSAFDGSFEKNVLGSTLMNIKGSEGLGRSQFDSAFSEEHDSSVPDKFSVPHLSIFNSPEVSHDSPPNDSELKHYNLPNIDTLLERENCDVESIALNNSDLQHVNDASVAVTNSVIQHVNEGDPKDKDLLEVQKNYCLHIIDETSSNSFKPTLDANEVLSRHMEKREETQTPSVESSFELPPSCKHENFQDDINQMLHDIFINQGEINPAQYEQYLQNLTTPSPVGDHQGSPYDKSPRSTPVPLADLVPQITRVDLELSSRCKDKHCMHGSCKRMLAFIAYRDQDAMPTELLSDLCHALQDHCVSCVEPKCSVMFCSSFIKWIQQSIEFDALMSSLHFLIKEPVFFLNLKKEGSTVLTMDKKLPVLQDELVIPLATLCGEFGSPLLARVMSPACPQLLVIKEISQILDCDQNITVYKRLRNLTHPNIVSHYWLKEYNDNSMHIFMEFIQGGSLNQYLDTVGRLTWDTAVYYFKQLAEAISFLHQHNIVYLYWDAGNILFLDCSYCHVKLGNLSMSCPVDQQQSNFDDNGTKHSMPPHLCPPELEIANIVDRKSDSWGAGCLMIEMLTGKPVWHDKRHESKHKLLQHVRHVAPSVPSNLKEAQQKFLQGCLQINIEDRWSFKEIKVFLEQPQLGKHLLGL